MEQHRHLIATASLDRDWVEQDLFAATDRLRSEQASELVMQGKEVVLFVVNRDDDGQTKGGFFHFFINVPGRFSQLGQAQCDLFQILAAISANPCTPKAERG